MISDVKYKEQTGEVCQSNVLDPILWSELFSKSSVLHKSFDLNGRVKDVKNTSEIMTLSLTASDDTRPIVLHSQKSVQSNSRDLHWTCPEAVRLREDFDWTWDTKRSQQLLFNTKPTRLIWVHRQPYHSEETVRRKFIKTLVSVVWPQLIKYLY